MKFATKLTATVVLVSVITVPALGVSIFYLTRNIIQENIAADQVRQTRGILNNIDRTLYNAYQDIELISKASHFELIIKPAGTYGKVTAEPHDPQQYRTDLNNIIQLTGPWDLLSIIDINGKIVYSSRGEIVGKSIRQYPIESTAHYAAVTGQKYNSDLTESDLITRPTVIFSSPIREKNTRTILGTVIGHFAWPIILQILDRTHSSNQIHLFNRDGVVIATPSVLGDQILKRRLHNNKLVKQLFSGKRVASGVDILDEYSETVVATAISQAGYLSYRGHDWGLLLEVPTKIAYAAVVQLARNITIVILIVMAIVSGLVYLLAKRITRPVEMLKNAAVAIGKGHFDTPISIKSGDELEALGDAFNEMAESRAYAEAELVKQERLAVLGQLTATVSHELRNPLGTIKNCLIYLDRYNKDKNALIKESTDNALVNVERCNNIISDLLNYTRQQPLEIKLTIFDQWFASLLEEYDHAPEIVLHQQLETGVEVGIDVENMRRAIINVLDNACQAMIQDDEEETIVEKDRYLTVATHASEGRIDVTVNDTGCGIKAENLPHIFEPFYSNKSFGTGLGLPSVEKIMEQHGGRVSVTSKYGHGTTVTLCLPLTVKEQ